VSRARCLVADDHPALVSIVAATVADLGFEVVGPASTGTQAVELAGTRPDLAVVDLRMPELSGVELVSAVAEASPATRIVVYTALADCELASIVLGAGAQAVLLKEAPLSDLSRVVRTVSAGGRFVDPALAGSLLRRENPKALSRREAQVLSLLADGLSYEEIALQLGLGAETVRTHVRRAAERLGAATRTQAVAAALRGKLIA
jgi:DNA-binding NarL/FixJ family response regulator